AASRSAGSPGEVGVAGEGIQGLSPSGCGREVGQRTTDSGGTLMPGTASKATKKSKQQPANGGKKIVKNKKKPKGHNAPAAEKAPPTWEAPFSNYAAGDIPLTIDQICDSLLAMTDGWPKCVSGTLCYFESGELQVLEDSVALFAWVGSHAPVEWRRGA